MADRKDNKELVKRATSSTMRPCTVRLNELMMQPEKFCHREEEELKAEKLELFLDSLILEGGVKVPVVLHTNGDGVKVLIAGHRRVTGCKILAERNEAGFSLDMELPAQELVEANPVDLLIESLSDNNNRQPLRDIPRLKAVKMLLDAGAEAKRSARALGVSDQTWTRDSRVVRYQWMYQHVEDRSIAPTTAAKLLKDAEEHKRIKEFKEDFDEFVAAKKKELKEMARRHKAKTNKDVRPADLEVKGHIKPHIVDHWMDCLKNGRRFDADADWDYHAGVEQGKLEVKGITLDLNKATGDMATKVLGALSQTVKDLIPYVQERVHIDKTRDQNKSKAAPYDFELLRQLGLTEEANRLEEKYQLKLEDQKDGEDDPHHDEIEERVETDMVEDDEVPETAAEPQKPAEPEKPSEPETGKADAPPAEKQKGEKVRNKKTA